MTTSSADIKRRTADRVCDAIPIGTAVTPREAWRLAGGIGAPAHVKHVLRGLEREGRIIRAGTLPGKGNSVGTNLWRRRL